MAFNQVPSSSTQSSRACYSLKDPPKSVRIRQSLTWQSMRLEINSFISMLNWRQELFRYKLALKSDSLLRASQFVQMHLKSSSLLPISSPFSLSLNSKPYAHFSTTKRSLTKAQFLLQTLSKLHAWLTNFILTQAFKNALNASLDVLSAMRRQLFVSLVSKDTSWKIKNVSVANSADWMNKVITCVSKRTKSMFFPFQMLSALF